MLEAIGWLRRILEGRKTYLLALCALLAAVAGIFSDASQVTTWRDLWGYIMGGGLAVGLATLRAALARIFEQTKRILPQTDIKARGPKA
jgi:hypothetical protein